MGEGDVPFAEAVVASDNLHALMLHTTDVVGSDDVAATSVVEGSVVAH
jgi:hypothetical protein